jgi:hypothetical protein
MSPDLAQDFAAQFAATGFAVREQTLGGRNDGYAEAALDSRQGIGGAVDPVTGS